MDFQDPYYGYSLILRIIVFGLVPAFAILQAVRLRRALHVFQLEGYKRARFLAWCRQHPERARFLRPNTSKKPLVMTGRAWRILAVAVALVVVATLVLPGIAHLTLGGWPADVATWGIVTMLLVVFVPQLLIVSDALLSPTQKAINARYLGTARRKLDDVAPTVVGVTGSFGKTSTKAVIAALLPDALATPSSFNTPLGVSRAVNENLDSRHRFFVVEMGAYGVGEIAELCDFVHHRIGVLTAIGPAHLERFGSLDNIRAAKYEIVETLPEDGVAIMNCDDPEVRALADATTQVEVVRFGLDPSGSPDVTASGVEVGPEGSSFTIVERATEGELPVRTRLLGRHSLGHVLGGVAVARAAGIRLAELAGPLASIQPVEHRLQLLDGTGGITVIDDAYNSNPDGAAAALEVLAAMPGERKVVVTPGIIELGPLQHDANEALGRHAGSVADTVIVVARLNRDALSAGARGAGGAEVVLVDSLAEARGHLRRLLRPGDVVLFENDLPDQYEG
ncbi:MAG: UDP-N-acetylmuramoyl-tripeptide--D-alanyl-D-alanine ligase [Actinomycetota bacterium]